VRQGREGFALLEVAVALIIIGLVMAGFFKGHELIVAARVRNLIAQQDAVKTAFFGFQDRYRALPGDYAAADRTLDCGATPCPNGNGNGRIEARANLSGNSGGNSGHGGSGSNRGDGGSGEDGANGGGNDANGIPAGGGSPAGGLHEEILVWTHLSAAHLVGGKYSATSAAVNVPDPSNTPTNAFGAFLHLAYDSTWGRPGNSLSRHTLKTGNGIPVEILSEVDRKIDDGNPFAGMFQFSPYAPSGVPAPNAESCISGEAWNIASGEGNCAAADLL
jgi:hypothetical protein